MMKSMRLIGLLLVGFAMAGLACSRANRNAVTLAGSTAFQPFAEKLAESYIALHPDAHVNVQGGGSAVGIQSALSGNADIGMADLLELPEEAKVLESIIVARDGIAVVVHEGNPISELSAAQVHDIFSGKIANWKEVGGADTPIRVISREEGSGTRRSFDSLVLHADKLTPTALFQNSNGTIREAVAGDPYAIGYVSISLVNASIKAIRYNGVSATNDNVKAGLYSLARPIFFLVKKDASVITRQFIEYVLSPEAQAILEKEGLIAAR